VWGEGGGSHRRGTEDVERRAVRGFKLRKEGREKKWKKVGSGRGGSTKGLE